MDNYKLKIKIGDAEFEAEGPVEIVQSQFESFKELIVAVPARKVTNAESTIPGEEILPIAINAPIPLEKIMKVEGRLVSLTAHSNSLEDAVMLVILGQKTFRNNDSITGGEVIDGLKQSGHMVSRIDKILERLVSEGRIIKIGTGRASRYRLTNQGLAKAQIIARDVIALVP